MFTKVRKTSQFKNRDWFFSFFFQIECEVITRNFGNENIVRTRPPVTVITFDMTNSGQKYLSVHCSIHVVTEIFITEILSC